jgi:hypothetical protein
MKGDFVRHLNTKGTVFEQNYLGATLLLRSGAVGLWLTLDRG